MATYTWPTSHKAYLPCAIRYSNPEITTWGWKQQKDGPPIQIKEGIMD